MERKFARTCAYVVFIAVLAAGVVAVATNNNIASAQTCSAQLGTPSVSSQPNYYSQPYYYYGGSFQVTVPVSASCSAYVGPLYAIGTAYYNGGNVGTANTALNPSGYGVSGQLTFNIPTSAAYNSVQFSVSIYSAQYGYGGALLTTASETYVLNYGNYPYYGSYPYYPYSGYYNGYQYPSYPSYSSPSYPSYPSYQHNYGGSWSGSNSGGSWHYSGNNGGYWHYNNGGGGSWHYSGNGCSGSYCYNGGSNGHHHHH